jgi:uncharacterized protein YndB with AHSA1/START domain
VCNDTLFLDIVPDERIVLAYSLSAEEVRTSAAPTTVELAADGGGTRVLLTEQVAFLDGVDGSASRERGLGALLQGAWERLSCGEGAQGPRVYDWAYAPPRPALRDGWHHALLVRRRPERADELAFYLVFCPTAPCGAHASPRRRGRSAGHAGRGRGSGRARVA